MNGEPERNIILSSDELCVALAAAGCRKVRGLAHIREVSENDVPAVMSGLARRGFVRSNGESFEAQGDFAEIIRLVGFAPDFYVLRSRKPNLPDLCCFGDKIAFALCESMSTKRGCVRIGLCGAEGLCEKLWSEGYFEEFAPGCAVSDEELEEFELWHLGRKEVFAEKDESSRRIFSINFVGGEGCEGYVDLVEYYLCTYILECRGEEKKRTLYSKEEMRGAICRLLQNDYDSNRNLCSGV